MGKFLRQELDFFIKNEIIHLDDIENETAPKVESYLAKVKAMRKVAGKIIQFLAQLEDFQKKIWLKKKFVLETHYCVTLDHIIGSDVADELLPIIAANNAQRDEWVKLFAIDELKGDLTSVAYSNPLTVDFLKANDKLLVDTKFFDANFKYALLSIFDDLDKQTDGLLINSDNFQALNTIEKRFHKQVNGIYIDPPYNTNATEIVYKNGYKHSSWLSLLDSRLRQAKSLLDDQGITCTTIDEYEVDCLSLLIKDVYASHDVRPVIIEYNHRGRVKSNFATTHEYALWSIPSAQDLITRQKDIADDIKRNLRRTGNNSLRTDSPSMFYGIEVNKETLEIIGVTDTLPLGESIPAHTNETTIMIWPVDSEGYERNWYFSKGRIMNEVKDGTVWAKIISGQIQVHYYLEGKAKRRKSVWVGTKMDASTHGSELLNEMFGIREFDFPKSIHAVQECLESMSWQQNVTFLDYFCGSATTPHAVLRMNREDK